MAGELENDRQRMMFREAIMPHERAATFALSRQESTEVRKWNAEQAEERLKNEAVTLAAGFDSPEAVDAAISSVRQVNLTINGDQGAETNDKNEMDIMRRLIGYGLDSLLSTDPMRAEAMLERFKQGLRRRELREAAPGGEQGGAAGEGEERGGRAFIPVRRGRHGRRRSRPCARRTRGLRRKIMRSM